MSSSFVKCSTNLDPHAEFLKQQREAVARHRRMVAETQVRNWRNEANDTTMLPPALKLLSLLRECFRYHNEKSAPETKELVVLTRNEKTQPSATSDTRRSFREIIYEATDALGHAAHHDPLEASMLATQTLAAFASIHPWSDGLAIHGPLLQDRRLMRALEHRDAVFTGVSGATFIKSFAAMAPLVQAIQHVSEDTKTEAVRAFFRHRRVCTRNLSCSCCAPPPQKTEVPVPVSPFRPCCLMAVNSTPSSPSAPIFSSLSIVDAVISDVEATTNGNDAQSPTANHTPFFPMSDHVEGDRSSTSDSVMGVSVGHATSPESDEEDTTGSAMKEFHATHQFQCHHPPVCCGCGGSTLSEGIDSVNDEDAAVAALFLRITSDPHITSEVLNMLGEDIAA